MLDIPKLAISVRQPWAWALIHAGKHLENRGPIAVRHMHAKAKPSPGAPVRLAIHASKGMTRDEYEHARNTMIDRCGVGRGLVPHPRELVRSAIIGHVLYVECITKSTSPWFFGPRALVFDEPVALATPIGCKGELGFFLWAGDGDLSDELARARDPAEPLPWMRKWTPTGAAPGAPSYINEVKGAGPLFDGGE